MRNSTLKHPLIFLLPFLFLYLLAIILQNPSTLHGDEGRYLWFSENLLNGFYSPPAPEINLWNGPGFPLYLVPFTALGAPLIIIRIFNGLLYFVVLLLFQRTISQFLDPKKTFLATVVFSLYYMPLKSLPFILSEIFTMLLIATITFLVVKYFSAKHKSGFGSTLLLSLLLAFLALTKVIFGYVFLFASIIFLLIYLIRRNALYLKAFILMVFALVFCLPYLIYTYSLTGRVFYWSNAGGMSMYWITSPFKGESGEWYSDSLTHNGKTPQIVVANHKDEYTDIYRSAGVERDDKFKEYALRNLESSPGKVFTNWIANWGRMFFNYPVSEGKITMGTLANMLANIPVLILLLFSFAITLKRRAEIPFAIKFLLIVAAVYLSGSSLLSAYDRMFYILWPVFGLWIAYSMLVLRNRST